MSSVACSIRDGSVEAVEDVQIAAVVADGAEEPGDGAVDFFVQAEVDEGVEGERRVSDPRVAVVPVLGAADPLRERGGGGRSDRTGMLGEQRLEGQCGPAHRDGSRGRRR